MDQGLLLGRCLGLTNKENMLSSSGGQSRSYDERVRHSTSSCDMDSFDLICKSSSVSVSNEPKYYLAKDFDKPVHRLPCKSML